MLVMTSYILSVNNKKCEAEAEPSMSLLRITRDHAGLINPTEKELIHHSGIALRVPTLSFNMNEILVLS